MSERSNPELFFPSQGPSTSTTASASGSRNGKKTPYTKRPTIRTYMKRTNVQSKDEDDGVTARKRKKENDVSLDVTYIANDKPIHVNVGGVVYTTTLRTLRKYPNSKLEKMFSGKLPLSVDRVNNEYFIDRDGYMFQHILNFLRCGHLLLPSNFGYLNLLYLEASYYELEVMVLKIKHLKELSYVRNVAANDVDVDHPNRARSVYFNG